MKPEQSPLSRALAFRDLLVNHGKVDGKKKPKNGQARRARGTGWHVRVAERRDMLRKPPGQ